MRVGFLPASLNVKKTGIDIERRFDVHLHTGCIVKFAFCQQRLLTIFCDHIHLVRYTTALDDLTDLHNITLLAQDLGNEVFKREARGA